VIRRSCLAGIILSYLPALAIAGLIVAVAAWAGALVTVLWLVVAAVVGYAQFAAATRHQRLQHNGGVQAGGKSQPELGAVVDEVMRRAGIRRLDGVWLVPGASAGALIGHRDWLGRRHLGLTIGLLTAAHLDIAELKAVLAHEAGHLTDANRLRLRLCARRRQAAAKLERRSSRLMWWYWTWFLTVSRELAIESERHADHVAAGLYGAEVTARALQRTTEVSALHAVTIARIVQPLWDSQITPITLFEAYEAIWTQAPGDVMATIEAEMNAGDSPRDTHPGLAERFGAHRYPLAPSLRGDLTLHRLADLDRRCSATLAREQLKRLTAMSWPEISAATSQEDPQGESSPARVASARPASAGQ
jgi:Zn-dependent protease with chaperone function